MSSYLDVHVSHQDDSPVQLGCFHVDQIERLAAGQQQEVRLKTKASASARSEDRSPICRTFVFYH